MYFATLVVCSCLIGLQSCGKKEANVAQSLNSPTGGTQATLDSGVATKPVDITDKNHRLMLRPKVGTTQRYHIITKSQRTQDIKDELFNGPQGKKASSNSTEYYLRQTIRAIKPDSSVDIAFRIDSIKVALSEDTQHISYSSNNAADRKNVHFIEYNIVTGQEFGTIISRFGEVLEIYGLQTMVNEIMKDLPDSMKTARYQEVTKHQLEGLLNQYISIVLTHFPDKPLAKDSTWSLHLETNMPVSDVVQFPVTVTSKETVKGFEDVGGTVLAVLDAESSQSPLQPSFEQGPTKASLQNFVSKASAVTHLEDASGILVKRTAYTSQSYVFMLESKQQAGKVARSAMTSNEETSVDLLQ